MVSSSQRTTLDRLSILSVTHSHLLDELNKAIIKQQKQIEDFTSILGDINRKLRVYLLYVDEITTKLEGQATQISANTENITNINLTSTTNTIDLEELTRITTRLQGRFEELSEDIKESLHFAEIL